MGCELWLNPTATNAFANFGSSGLRRYSTLRVLKLCRRVFRTNSGKPISNVFSSLSPS